MEKVTSVDVAVSFPASAPYAASAGAGCFGFRAATASDAEIKMFRRDEGCSRDTKSASPDLRVAWVTTRARGFTDLGFLVDALESGRTNTGGAARQNIARARDDVRSRISCEREC